MTNAERALEAARRARRAFVRGDTRDAAWLALWSTELDPAGGLGLAMVARILHEVSADPLATVVTREAQARGLPEPERLEVARFHRIDLWSRGLLAHRHGQSLLPASAFEEASAFTATEACLPWFEERELRWGSRAGACRALRRLVGALSDAWEMPAEPADPLRSDALWADMPAYAAWKADDPLAAGEPDPDPDDEADLEAITVISDHWTEHTLARLEARDRLGEAQEIAAQWATLRPGRVAPLIAVMRLASAMGQEDRVAEAEAELLDIETEDLNELEEARVGLGLLRRFEAQMTILDAMNTLAPGQPVILANRGAAALELGRTETAEADLRLALELDPKSGPALTNLALLRMREEDYVAARALLEEAKSLHPDEAPVRYYLAACLANQSHPEAALREARKALELDPGFAAAHALLEQLDG
ncbi:MAG: tetratricopeptide repeat protein [Myxococcota bacterium]